MKRMIVTLASLSLMIGLVGTAEAGAHASKPARTTTAPPELKAAVRESVLAKLGSNTHLTKQQLKAMGLKPASHRQMTLIRQLRENNTGAKAATAGAKAATAGSTYWYTWQNARNSWVDRYYDGPYYSYPWYPYYVLYDNFKTCTYAGSDCIDANAYTSQYLLYYYPQGTWYDYNTGGYQYNTTDHSGFGPYSG